MPCTFTVIAQTRCYHFLSQLPVVLSHSHIPYLLPVLVYLHLTGITPSSSSTHDPNIMWCYNPDMDQSHATIPVNMIAQSHLLPCSHSSTLPCYSAVLLSLHQYIKTSTSHVQSLVWPLESIEALLHITLWTNNHCPMDPCDLEPPEHSEHGLMSTLSSAHLDSAHSPSPCGHRPCYNTRSMMSYSLLLMATRSSSGCARL